MVRILGSTGTRRRRRYQLAAIFSVTALLAAFAALPAQAVHDVGVFELDRNATDDSGQPTGFTGEDWTNICPASTPQGIAPFCTGVNTAERSTFDTDIAGAGDDIFTGAQSGGNSKDPDLISGWRWKIGSVQDKDDLEHAYAAQYLAANGNVYLYVGADRFSVSGDAELGFWLFRKKVAENPIPAGSNVGTFTGSHTARSGCPGPNCTRGDILILSDFLRGGASPTVRVFEWVGSGGSDGSLDLIAGTTATPADCLGNPNQKPPVPPVGNGDNFCATVNIANTNSPWAYTPKAGSANVFPAGAFFEGGINMTALGLGNECFTTFEAETRASQSPTATLSDFAIHTFAPCGATLTTTSSRQDEVTPGTKVHDTATVTGTGTASPPFPTSDPAHSGTKVSFTICGPIGASPDTCDPNGDANHMPVAVPPGASPNDGSLSPTATQGVSTATSGDFDTTGKTPGRYCWQASWPGDENYTDGASSTSYANECFTVAQRPTSTLTTPVDGSGVATSQVVLGGTVYDKAVVTGDAVGDDPTGDVNFFVCKIATGTCDKSDADHTGTAVTGNPKSLVSDGVAGTYTASATSGAVTPTSTGRYCFRAEYGGNTVYLPSSDSGIGDSECFTVISLSTSPTLTPQDSATLSGLVAGGTPQATIRFTLYAPGDTGCTGSTVFDSGAINVTGSGTYSTSNTTLVLDSSSATGTYRWKVVYSGDSKNLAITKACGTESFNFTNITAAAA